MIATAARARTAAALAACLLALLWGSTFAEQDRPQDPAAVFRAGTELIAIDATVVDGNGDPVPGLTADDFVLTIDGEPRRVVSAEFYRQDPEPARVVAGRPLPYSTNEEAAGGRLVLIIFDLEGISQGGGRAAANAAAEFITELGPSDRVGLLGYPSGVTINFTSDRETVRQGLNRVVGRGQNRAPSRVTVGISEALPIDRGDSFALQQVTNRECGNLLAGFADDPAATNEDAAGDAGFGASVDPRLRSIDQCQLEIRSEARNLVVVAHQRAADTLRLLRQLFAEFRNIDAPKTIVWVSEGLLLGERRSEIGGLSAEAAAARTTIYAIQLDDFALADASERVSGPTLMQDRQLAVEGLETIAGVTRGAVFRSVGSGSNAFARIAREMGAYYLLSVEPAPGDRDGDAHQIRVTTARTDLRVRARRTFTLEPIPPAGTIDPEQVVADLLRAPLISTELPLRVATHNLREPGQESLRVVITTEIGNQHADATQAAVGYMVATEAGKVVASAFHRAAGRPRMTESGPLETVGIIEVPPGSYTLRVAVMDRNGRKGSVDHPFEAKTRTAGPLDLSDLMLAPGAGVARLEVYPATSTELSGSDWSAYLELYPRDRRRDTEPRVTIEVTDESEAPPLAAVEAQVVRSEHGLVARARLPLALLPPGDYLARAAVVAGGETVHQTRPFRLERAVAGTFDEELAAEIGEFQIDQVFVPALLDPALARARALDGGAASADVESIAARLSSGDPPALAEAARLRPGRSLLAVFVHGLGLLHARELEEAAGEFRSTLKLSSEFFPAIFYLGSCYAAGGRGREAVGAWQTSLVGDDSIAEVFRLLADGYLRLGDQEALTSTLEEAAAKWPDDRGFVLRAALARARAGETGDALGVLAPWLDQRPDDGDVASFALRLAMADLAAHEPPEPATVTSFRRLVETLRRGGAPTPRLADRWLAYLDGRGDSQ